MLYLCGMKRIIKQLQVVAIYDDKYVVVFTSKDDDEVKEYAKNNRAKLKRDGALKVITNTGTYYEEIK